MYTLYVVGFEQSYVYIRNNNDTEVCVCIIM